MKNEQLELLKSKLAEPLPGRAAQEKMVGRVRPMPLIVPENAKPSAVLCLLFPVNEQMHILLMKRREDNTAHSGQVSFPGGRYEEQDANYQATALREANEEVGILAAEVEILTPLTTLYIPVSNFNVYPFLAYTGKRPEYSLSHQEVSYVLEVPLETLYRDGGKVVTDVTSPVRRELIKNVHAYQLPDDTIIWGATAMILSEIEAIIAKLTF